jgi:hypothetical protein
MRGVGTPTGNIFPGVIRRTNEGTIQNSGAASVALSTWDVRTSDLAAVVEGAGYLNAHAVSIKTGDVVMIVMGVGGVMKLKLYVATSDGVGVVSIALQTTTAG